MSYREAPSQAEGNGQRTRGGNPHELAEALIRRSADSECGIAEEVIDGEQFWKRAGFSVGCLGVEERKKGRSKYGVKRTK